MTNSPPVRDTCPVPLTCRWPICRAGSGNLPPGDNQSFWFARLTVDPSRRRHSYSPRAYGMSPTFVAEQTGGIDKGWLSNSGRILAEIADD